MRAKAGSLALLALIVGVIALIGLYEPSNRQAIAQERIKDPPVPMFAPGKQYLVIVDCLPAAVVQLPAFPCYAELLTVRSIRSDNGWVVTTTAQGDEWTINPARVYAVTPAQGESIRAQVERDSGRVPQPPGIP